MTCLLILGYFLLIPAVAPVFVIMAASITIPSVVISPTIPILASIAISHPVIISTIIAVSVVTKIVAIPISMTVRNHNTHAVFLILLQDCFL